MKVTKLIAGIAAVMGLALTTACSHSSDTPDDPSIAMLHINVSLVRSAGYSRATGDEYNGQRPAINDGERLHNLRIIIIDGDGYVEHNTRWNLDVPASEASGADFPVRNNDDKTILFVGNEDGKTVVTADGTEMSLTDYLNTFNAFVGMHVDVDDVRKVTMPFNPLVTEPQMETPLPITAIHKYHVGNVLVDAATFTLTRAAVKYTTSFRNSTDKPHTVRIRLSNIPRSQYLFFDADFTDDTNDGQYFWTAYRTPAGPAATSEALYFNYTVGSGRSVDLPLVYLPEGPAGTQYTIGVIIDDNDMGDTPIRWYVPQTPGQLTLMTDLPRNTNVVTEIEYIGANPVFTYQVCPWNTEDDIVIPPFN